MNKTSIEWCTYTSNPLRAATKALPATSDPAERAEARLTARSGHYCEKTSPGCTHCYSSRLQPRFGTPQFGAGQFREQVDLFLDVRELERILRHRKPEAIFWGDMTDIFGDWVEAAWLDQCLAVCALPPQHTHMWLTKRAERMQEYFSDCGLRDRIARLMDQPAWINLPTRRSFYRAPTAWPLPNLWLGVSVENQEYADERIPLLLDTPAAVRFLSIEPLLGPVDLRSYTREIGTPGHCVSIDGDWWHAPGLCAGSVNNCSGKCCRPRIDWAIVGGESGPGARPCNVEWIRSIVRQCKSAGTPCFVKQLGAVPYADQSESWSGAPGGMTFIGAKPDGGAMWGTRLTDRKGGDISEFPEDLRVREMPEVRA